MMSNISIMAKRTSPVQPTFVQYRPVKPRRQYSPVCTAVSTCQGPGKLLTMAMLGRRLGNRLLEYFEVKGTESTCGLPILAPGRQPTVTLPQPFPEHLKPFVLQSELQTLFEKINRIIRVSLIFFMMILLHSDSRELDYRDVHQYFFLFSSTQESCP